MDCAGKLPVALGGKRKYIVKAFYGVFFSFTFEKGKASCSIYFLFLFLSCV